LLVIRRFEAPLYSSGVRSVGVTGPDGRYWYVFRRRVAWRPRLPRWASPPDAGPQDGGVLDLVIGGLLMLFTLVAFPVWLWYLASWIASLIATPFVAHEREKGRRPTPVIARRSDAERDEWVGQAADFSAAQHLIVRVAREIQANGEPGSLAPPGS
jgi:hypothetical protein